MTQLLLVAGFTLLASFVCSLLEAALYAMSTARIELLRIRGVRGADRLARLRSDVEAPIAAILTVNTIAHTVGAAWCGAMVSDLYGSAAVGAFAAIFTVLVLAVTEIVPKSIGVRYANQLGLHIVWPLQIMIWGVWPVVWLAKRAMGWMSGASHVSGPSEDEVLVLSRLAAKRGSVRHEEYRWVQNALQLDRVTAADLRTPRTVVEALPADTSVSEVVQHAERWVHSRLPLTEGNDVDQVIGLVYRREVFDAALASPDADLILRDLMHPIQFVPDTMPAHRLLERFLTERVHMLAVVDEYGGFEGVVTLEDVIECFLGREIVDEHDRFADLQALAIERSRRRHGDLHDEGSDTEPRPPPGAPAGEKS